MLDCVVIGAGQAGLAASFHLRELGVDHVVLERGSVAETWRTARWDSFCLNTPRWATRLPGLEAVGDPDVFSPLAEVIATLTGYAERIAAPIRRAEVRSLGATGGSFQLGLEGEVLEARSVVVATGAFQLPTFHPASASVPSGILQMHTAAYRNPSQLRDGGVLIVGSGQSGCEIGLELLEAGRPVHLAVGRCGWAPRRYRGRELIRWMVEVGAMDETSDGLASPQARLAGNVAVSGSRGGRDCNPLVLEAAGARLHGRLLGIENRRARFAPDLDANLEFGARFERDLCRRFDDYAEQTGLTLEEHVLQRRARTTRAIDTELSLDGEVTSILWAGGYRPAFDWIDLPVLDELGFPRAVRGLSATPGLAFVGLPWLHKRKSPLLLGVGDDAAHVAEALAAHLDTN